MTDMPSRPIRRADAVRNQHAVIEAATQVFAEQGLGACIAEVAARAGVGKATVYRSFPTREHLVAAVVEQRLRDFTDRVGSALESADAGGALHALLVDTAERQARDRSYPGDHSVAISLPAAEQAREVARSALATLLRRAQQQGTVRPDVSALELRMLFTGVGRALAAADDRDPATWRRCAELVWDAVRTH